MNRGNAPKKGAIIASQPVRRSYDIRSTHTARVRGHAHYLLIMIQRSGAECPVVIRITSKHMRQRIRGGQVLDREFVQNHSIGIRYISLICLSRAFAHCREEGKVGFGRASTYLTSCILSKRQLESSTDLFSRSTCEQHPPVLIRVRVLPPQDPVRRRVKCLVQLQDPQHTSCDPLIS